MTFRQALAAALILAANAASAQTQWSAEWPSTDFSRTSIDLGEVISGGPPRDGIPAIDGPDMIPLADAVGLDEREPVLSVEIEGAKPRAYPIRYLIWHEIVNDRIAGRPVTITYCPLCNSALVFDGRLGDRELTFGVTGKLRHSDMIMYDRETESWWQQFTGEEIVGELLGAELESLPAMMESLGAFRARAPEGLVMAQPASHARPYGQNPYRFYDTSASPFLYRGENPPHDVEPLARVVRVGDRAWPLERLRAEGEIEEAGVRLEWTGEHASALDAAAIPEGRSIGSVRVTDAATGAPVVGEVVFAFAFHAFEPDGRWMMGE